MSDSGLIDVGASDRDGSLRLWSAREAMRQGELRLAAQATARTALEARATALTGWAAAGLVALVGGAASTTDRLAWAAAAIAGAPLLASAILGVHAARPRPWSLAGYDPPAIELHHLSSELETLEGVAQGLSRKIGRNEFNLTDVSRQLLLAGWFLIGTPVLGASAYALLHGRTNDSTRSGSASHRSVVALEGAAASTWCVPQKKYYAIVQPYRGRLKTGSASPPSAVARAGDIELP